MTETLPSIAAMRARLVARGCLREYTTPPNAECECIECDTIRVLDAVMPLLEDADVDWITRTTEHETTIRALLAGEGGAT